MYGQSSCDIDVFKDFKKKFAAKIPSAMQLYPVQPWEG